MKMIQREQITALILAGGRGSRMGGVDKGLQTLDGEPLVQHALRRIAPQVGLVMISANRHPEVYRGYGVPVLADADTDYPGPLAGFLAGLAHCRTDWMATVPCDTPRFPEDLVATLAAAAGDARAVVAVTEEAGERQRQSVFCLLRADLQADLAAYLAEGGRKIERWLERQGCVDVLFDDADAFFNANTIDELRRLGGA
jgi:molybdopterin-guanine dinucleotide biosynthesis protein A